MAMRAFPDAPTPWIDLSTGLNPLAYPIGDVPSQAWTRLPERQEIAALEQAAAQAYGVSDAADIVAAPGAQSLIQWLPLLFPTKRVAVLGPTYEEHAARWAASGAQVRVVERLAPGEAVDTVVVVNPNNPDGRLLPRNTLARLARHVAGRGGRLVIDEAFIDLLPADASYAPLVRDADAIVLRSFGKTYGLGGLRLGFAIATRPDAARIRDALGPWAVSGAAVAIGRRALADTDWLAAAQHRLQADTSRLDRMLAEAGLAIVGGTPLFRLASHQRAEAVHTHLCRSGILTRRFARDGALLRFGLPDHEDEWDRVASALATVRTERSVNDTSIEIQ